MKLFDLLPDEKRGLRRFVLWHLAYAAYVCILFFVIYGLGLFKAYWFLEEFWIVNMWGPLHTIVFVLISPYRDDWKTAIGNMYRALDGDIFFCIMALLVFGVGFYLYSLLIWVAGGMFPSMLYN